MSLEELEAEVQEDALGTLRKMQLWQLAAVPFGSLGLHYSVHHTVSLDTDVLFHKLVDRRMGGYCMENNTFFATVLRSLGYRLYSTGARVSCAVDQQSKDPENYGGWSHMLLMVTIDNQKYVVDVGFGTSGPTQPMLLAESQIFTTVPTMEGQLVHRPIAPVTDRSQRMWVYEVRNSSESPWVAQYCFSELEFLPQDFNIMNYYISHSRESWFTQKIVLAKFLLSEDQKRAVGNVSLAIDVVRQRLNGQSETLMTCRTEEDRVKALEMYFQVDLRAEDIRGIQGLPVEITQS